MNEKSERIILSVELIKGDKDARCSMRVPVECLTIEIGEWLEQAIVDLRPECKQKLAEKMRQA